MTSPDAPSQIQWDRDRWLEACSFSNSLARFDHSFWAHVAQHMRLVVPSITTLSRDSLKSRRHCSHLPLFTEHPIRPVASFLGQLIDDLARQFKPACHNTSVSKRLQGVPAVLPCLGKHEA